MSNGRPPEYKDEWGSCELTYAMLCIYSGDVHPDEVSRRLDLIPERVTIAGRSVTNSLGRTRTDELNAWFLSSEHFVTSLDMRRHLDWLLDRMEEHAEAIASLRADPAMSVRVKCSWWSKTGAQAVGPVLSPHQMSRLCALDADLEIWFSNWGEDDRPVSDAAA